MGPLKPPANLAGDLRILVLSAAKAPAAFDPRLPGRAAAI
jgi:hypothetical protein